jgi:hypothetical protein
MKVLQLEELTQHLEERKAQLGITGGVYMPLNSGRLRTESKRALLQAIRDNAAKQGREPLFAANF